MKVAYSQKDLLLWFQQPILPLISCKTITFVFSTDAEYKDISFKAMSPVIEFFRDADVLIFDAQYVFTDAVQMKRDWGHSSSFVGIDVALDAEVKSLYLFHHDPMHTDETLLKNLNQAHQYLRNMEPDSNLYIDLAYEGQHIILE